MNQLGTKGRQLLRVLTDEIRSGRIRVGDPTTFIPYSKALAALGYPNAHLFAGRRLQGAGLMELNEWTKTTSQVPKIDGLIVNKSSYGPSDGYCTSHGFAFDDPAWEAWWMRETAKAIEFDWTPYL